MSYFDFGVTLRKLRKTRGITQQELGAQIGTTKAVISKYETGIGYPGYDTLLRLSAYFGVTTDYLLGIKNSKTINASGLSDEQIDAINRIITEFRKANNK